MNGASVHERLQKMGATHPINVFTEVDEARLRRDYAKAIETGEMDRLASEMGRTRQFLCRKARLLGLTDIRRAKPFPTPAIRSATTKAAQARFGHPRGMLGKTHSDVFKDNQSQRSFDRWHGMSEAERIAFAETGKTSWKAGWREVGGVRKFYRSQWEANYARYLQWLLERREIAAWAHEAETFWFDAIKRGVRSYLPDFRVTENDGRVVFHEVKGWMTDRSKTALKRMKKYHPTVEILLIEKRQYTAILRSAAGLIEGWE